MAQLIQDAWAAAEEDLSEWQEVVGDHPTFVAAMARHYVAAAQTDQAEKALKRSIELSPDLWAFQDLAEVYRKKGDLGRAQGRSRPVPHEGRGSRPRPRHGARGHRQRPDERGPL